MLIENYYISEKKDNYDASMMINVLPRVTYVSKKLILMNLSIYNIQYTIYNKFDGKWWKKIIHEDWILNKRKRN